jgi:hypothetical protein
MKRGWQRLTKHLFSLVIEFASNEKLWLFIELLFVQYIDLIEEFRQNVFPSNYVVDPKKKPFKTKEHTSKGQKRRLVRNTKSPCFFL